MAQVVNAIHKYDGTDLFHHSEMVVSEYVGEIIVKSRTGEAMAEGNISFKEEK